MTGKRILRILKFVVFAALFITVAGFVVMNLWNWLLPGIFGLHLITFRQAIGILILCKILFGGFRGGRGGHFYWRRGMMERWEHMSLEERESFRAAMRRSCGPFSATAEPKTKAVVGPSEA
jgi:Ca2+/H+ antiporter, TMEM165/GDT1 family